MPRFGVFILFLLTAAVGFSQTNYPPVGIPQNSALVPVPLGFINTMGLQLHQEIPIVSIPVRGGPSLIAKLVRDESSSSNGIWSFNIGRDNMGFVTYSSTNTGPCPSGYFGSAVAYSNFVLTDNSGTVHLLSIPTLNYNGGCVNSLGQNWPNSLSPTSGSGTAEDGSGFTANASILLSNGFVQNQAWALDGSRVFDSTSTPSAYAGDTNGNYEGFATSTQGGGQFAGNPITGGGISCGQYTTPGKQYVYVHSSDGSQQTYTLTCQLFNYSDQIGNHGASNRLSSLTLPDGSQYTFQYDSGTTGNHLLELTSVTLPAGGQVSYGHTITCGLNACYQTINSVTFAGGTWTFTGTTSQVGNKYQGVVNVLGPTRYDAILKSNIRDKSVYTSTLYTAGQTPALQTAQYYNGASSLLKTVSASYVPVLGTNPYYGVCLSSLITTLNDSGQSSQLQYQYGSAGGVLACGLVTQKQEWDYGATAPTRTTKITYLTNTGSINYNSQYHIYNRPISINVYAGSGTGSPAASTTYNYDEYSANYCKNSVPMLTSVTGATNHDDTYHGGNFYARGNVTSIGKLVSGTTWVTSHKCYDTLGNTTQEVDPVGNPISYDYSDKWADSSCVAAGVVTRAFPTTVTDGLNLRARTTFYSCTGLPQAKADENDIGAGRNGTTFTYDWKGRPLCSNFPDGGQTCKIYTSSLPPTITQNTLLASGTNISIKTLQDTYGRTSESQNLNDPDGVTNRDTTYDALGNVLTTSNPYRSVSDTTYGVTTQYYDALKRVTLINEPDGSTLTKTYSGSCVTETDEAGISRKTCLDSFSRKAGIWEDPAGLNYETDYTYDVLDNLTSVTQKGGASSSSWRVRNFGYDSLSRLTTSINPESGTIKYTYDPNGNLQSRTSPIPNQINTTNTQTISYCYDALNRLIGKGYGQQSCPLSSPAASYFYDQTSYNGLTIANGKSRRTGMADASGASSWSYDPTGRVSLLRRMINGHANNATYTYSPYLNGELANLTYFSGSQVAYTWSQSDRPLTAIDPYPINFVKNATYAPFGAVNGATYGAYNTGFPGTTVSNSYNNRLQPALLSAASPAMTLFSLSYNFNQGTQSLPKDNGNVVTIQNNRDNTRTQTFTYDSLNRINTAQTTSSLWGDSYVIDPWGNLTNKNIIAGKGGENLQTSANLNNQLAGMTYDVAGNLINDGLGNTYVYDAENRIIGAGGQSYIYDGDGNRVEKCTTGTIAGTCASGATGTLYWHGSDGEVLNESDLAASTWKRFVYFDGQMVARRDSATGNVYYFYSDHLGSVGVVADALGQNIINESDYFPYGAERPVANSLSDEHYKFTAQEHDSESTLDYFIGRHYSSATARFLSPDPDNAGEIEEDPQTWNMYAYARNNPLRYVDPDGLAHCVLDKEGGCYWVGDFNGECQSQMGQTVCWDAKSGIWQLLRQPDRNDGVTPAFLGPIDFLLFGFVGGASETVAEEAIVKTAAQEAAEAAAEKAAQQVTKELVRDSTKQAIRDAIEREGLNDGQKAAVKRALSRGGASHKYTLEKLADGSIKLSREVAGRTSGRAVYEQVIDQSGTTVSVVQKAYSTTGDLVHVDQKYP